MLFYMANDFQMLHETKDGRIAKLHKELIVIAKQKSSFAYDAKVEKVKNAITIKPAALPTEMVFKVNKFQLVVTSIALLVLVVFLVYSIVLFIQAGMYYLSHFGFIVFMGIVAGYGFVPLSKRKVVLDKKSIAIEKDWIAWGNVLECFIMQYPIGKHRKWILYIAFENGELRQYDIAGLNDIALSHYIYHYMQIYKEEAETTSLPS